MSRRIPLLPAVEALFALAVMTAVAVMSAMAVTTAPPAQAAPSGDAQPQVHAFVGVHVIPMDRERILEDRTVVVRNGVIETVGPRDEVRVPEEAHRIAGGDRYLIPGLAEMHAHIPGEEADAQWMEDLLFLYAANGVTTIRGMLGAPNQLDLRAGTAEGTILGPRIIVGAPSLRGNTAPTPDDAERLVREHAQAGYDFLKIHPGVPLDSWARMVEVAREEGITFAGHVPADVGLRHALETGMSTVDHLDGYLQEVVTPEVRERMEAGEEVALEEALRSVDPGRVREIARITREAGAWNVPTLYLWENFYNPVDPDSMISLPEMRYVPPSIRQGWAQAKENRGAASPEVADLHAGVRRDILRAIHEEGAGILLGTDSPQMFNVPGFAMHREVPIMEAAGMSRFEILASGTRNVAEYVREELGLEGDFGVIEPGMGADLVLLESNPLEDLAALEEVAGVMLAGRWLDGSEIRAGLAELASRYADSPVESENGER